MHQCFQIKDCCKTYSRKHLTMVVNWCAYIYIATWSASSGSVLIIWSFNWSNEGLQYCNECCKIFCWMAIQQRYYNNLHVLIKLALAKGISFLLFSRLPLPVIMATKHLPFVILTHQHWKSISHEMFVCLLFICFCAKGEYIESLIYIIIVFSTLFFPFPGSS